MYFSSPLRQSQVGGMCFQYILVLSQQRPNITRRWQRNQVNSLWLIQWLYEKDYNEISEYAEWNFKHISCKLNLQSPWGQSCLLCCPQGGSQSPACRQVHAGELLIFDVTGGIIFMCRVWCLDGDKHGWVAGPITKTISTRSSTRWAM